MQALLKRQLPWPAREWSFRCIATESTYHLSLETKRRALQSVSASSVYQSCRIAWTMSALQVIPAWAQKTLTAHNGDKRELKSLEQMEKGETGDAIWDALQYQLNVTGIKRSKQLLRTFQLFFP